MYNIDVKNFFSTSFVGHLTYENIIVLDDTKSIPSEADVNAKIQEFKDADTQKENDKTSGENKLKALGLTDAEIKALTGA